VTVESDERERETFHQSLDCQTSRKEPFFILIFEFESILIVRLQLPTNQHCLSNMMRTAASTTATATVSAQSVPIERTTPWTLGATMNYHAAAYASSSSHLGTSSNHRGTMPTGGQPTSSTRIGMRVNESPSPHPPEATTSPYAPSSAFLPSAYQTRLLSSQSVEAVEAVLAASCAAMGFDIAEIWLRTGPKTHQLINSHLRHTALDETLRDQLVEVYYGDSAAERTHRLSPALCKKAKEDNDVVWVTAQTESGAKALSCSLNGVLTAVAVPVCHDTTNSNLTVIYFSVKRATMRPEAIEFLVHTSLAAAVASVNNFMDDNEEDWKKGNLAKPSRMPMPFDYGPTLHPRVPQRPNSADFISQHPYSCTTHLIADHKHEVIDTSRGVRPVPSDDRSLVSIHSVTGANLNLRWSDLSNVEYLTDGGNNWIHTAVMCKSPVVIKQLKPEVKDVAVAINEIEGELAIHSLLDHDNIVSLYGAGFTTDKSRFLVLERLDGGTLTQQLGYDTRIRDRRRRFWKKHKMPYVKVLEVARQIAEAMDYCHRRAVPGSMVLHRDLKPDNIGKFLWNLL
jgi:Serine/threonine protein kinase